MKKTEVINLLMYTWTAESGCPKPSELISDARWKAMINSVKSELLEKGDRNENA